MNTDMTTIIGTVKMTVTQATEELIASAEDEILEKNNFHLQNMDDTFAKNMDLMQQLHSTSTSDIKTVTSIVTDKAIATFPSKKDICMKNISEDIQNNKEVKAITNGIVYDIAQCKSNAIKEIEGLVATSQTTCAGHIASMTRAHITNIKDLLSCKDSAVTDLTSFQTKL